MCGIAGYRSFGPNLAALAPQLGAATQSLLHRGPDDGGQWIADDGVIGLGHRRLSIIDLSALGHQPMRSVCGRWMMVYNGEVYNFREIRAELEAVGHVFRGTGDSEVILAGFSQWGADAAKRFIGMFAIALWHQPTRELHLIRDRLGVKPLYYHWDGRFLCFGSELKALRAFTGWRPEVDPRALEDYLREGYIDHPMTIYRRVFKVPPAHRVTLRDDAQLKVARYWHPLEARRDLSGRSEDDLTDELEALLTSAFKYRMIADVPVGVFLSGGVDSSLLAALLAKHAGQRINTFTIGFDEAGYDESPHAEAVARHLGTHQTTRHLTLDTAMLLLPQWGDLYDEPFADPSGLPTLLVSRMAAEKVKVVLSADGGDELFGGYGTYVSVIARLNKLRGVPRGVRAVASTALRGTGIQLLDDWLARQRWPGQANQALRARTTMPLTRVAERIAPQPEGQHFDRAKHVFSDREMARLLGREPEATRLRCDDYPGDIGDRMGLWDLEHYMAEDILTKVDRATMAASIEGREPLIDHRLVEFAFSLPFNLKHGALGTKHLLRKVLYRHVPRELVERPKQGFSVPIGTWLTGSMKRLPEQALERSRVLSQGLLEPAEVARQLTRLHAGDPLAANRVWTLTAFQMWHERWME
jgi:asparagine synthase (glutamine-hydrolysing)